MLGGGEAGRGVGGSVELRDAQRENIRRYSGTNSDARMDAGFAEGASEAKNAGERGYLALRAGR